jgi:UTP:GlnB (protein PII) uridylyltransferase
MSNVYHQFPEHACFIRDLEILNRESNKILNHLPFQKSIEARKRAIGNYYDLKFLQVGLDTFKGASVYQINHQYTQFVSVYFKELFGVCLSEVVKNANLADRLRKYISIYACGGNGREQAFDDDFDLIIIVHCEKKEDRNIYREIIALMNTQMLRRGTLPHFRFTHHFGEYFCPYQDLKFLLNSEYAESYIDISQLLECRLLVGGQRLHQKFMNEIIAATIFAKTDSYIEQMKREISQRHGSTTFFRTKCANIKECIGGLRDIEMIILIYKVYYKLIDINPYNLIQKFSIKDKNLSSCWKKIQTSLLFLQRFRYLYRLMITAEDNIYSHGLDRVAATFNPELPSHSNKSEWLWEQFLFHRKRAWQSLRQLLDFMTDGN